MTRYGTAALAGELDRLELAATGFRHRTLFSAACRLGELVAGGELDLGMTEGALIEKGRSLGLADCDVRRQVARGIEKGRTRPRKAPETGVTNRAEALAEVVAWWEALQRFPPEGRTAGTTLRILTGFRNEALSAGKLRLAESYREIAEAAGVSVSTVAARRKDWAPWVRRVSKGRHNRFDGSRTTWQLVTREGRATTNSPASPEGEASGLFVNARSLVDPGHHLWHRWSNGHRLYCLLDLVDANTTQGLAAVTGLHPGSVRRIASRLVDLGVANRDDDGWRATHVDIATALELHLDGVDHAGDRRDRHASERDLHRKWLRGAVEAAERPKLVLVRSLPTTTARVPPAERDQREVVA